MAQFRLSSFIDVGTKGYHTATSWKATRDAGGLDIIDESINDSVNITVWNSPLPDGVGGFYSDLDAVHLWVRCHILNDISPWYYAGFTNQNDQQFTITENGVVIDVVNSLVAGIQ